MLLGLLFGLAGMGSSSAAVTLPLLGADLGVDAGLAAWTISLYVLMLAVTTALYGRISDLVGVRAPLLAGLVLMSVGALVAALAPTFEVLLGARVLQGAGAAAVPTLGVAVLSARYSGEVRGLAFGRLAGVAAAVSCLGPLIGGAGRGVVRLARRDGAADPRRPRRPVPVAGAVDRRQRRPARRRGRRPGRPHRRRDGAAGAVAVGAGWSSPRSARRCSSSACRPCARPYADAPTASCRSR